MKSTEPSHFRGFEVLRDCSEISLVHILGATRVLEKALIVQAFTSLASKIHTVFVVQVGRKDFIG